MVKNKGVLLVIQLSIFPVVFLYCRNFTEISLLKIIPFLLLFPFGGICLYGAIRWLTGNPCLSALAAAYLTVVLLNYKLIESAVTLLGKDLKYWHILPVLLLLAVVGTIGLNKTSIQDRLKDIVTVLFIVSFSLNLINIIPALPGILDVLSKEKIRTEEKTVINTNRPNIYWFVFDECASFSVIKDIYSYDNSNTVQFLKQSGFSVSETSCNENIKTHSILTNCMNLDYVVGSTMSNTQIKEAQKSPYLLQLLNEQGYSINGIGDTEWMADIKSLTSQSHAESKTINGEGVDSLLLGNTFLYPWVQKAYSEAEKDILSGFSYFEDSQLYSPCNSNFYFCYFCSPHQPFLFTEDGRRVNSANYANWDDEQYYLGQYKFIINKMRKTVQNIIAHDANSVIILSSDHGPRFNEKMSFSEKTNILNAVYFCGNTPPEIEGESLVNTLRITLSKLFDIDLPKVDVIDVQ